MTPKAAAVMATIQPMAPGAVRAAMRHNVSTITVFMHL